MSTRSRKNLFLFNEIWLLTFSAAFQRANIYSKNASSKDKNDFKKALREHIENNLQPKYKNSIKSEDLHLENIQSIIEFSSNFSSILAKKKLNFGIAQKILNLYLKYLWCMDFIPCPPHFPVDRRIQQSIHYNPIIPWTRINTKEEYYLIINFAKLKLKDNQTLAEFELENFQRSNDV